MECGTYFFQMKFDLHLECVIATLVKVAVVTSARYDAHLTAKKLDVLLHRRQIEGRQVNEVLFGAL